jgi:Spy/CpxP family protein refolding chaperone
MNETSATRKAAVWVGIVFLLGVALGGIAGYAFAHRGYAVGAASTNEIARRQQRVEQLTQELSLTTAQRQQLDVILAGMVGQFKTIRKQIEPQMDVAREKGRNQIRAILTPEQKPKFEDFLKRLDEERKKNAQ